MFQMRFHLQPGLGAGRHLAERSKGKTGDAFRDDGPGEPRWCFESETISDVLFDSPKLFAPGHGLPAAMTQIDEVVPSLTGAVPVDYPEEIVGVRGLDGVE
jgi:hypothetical protein